MEFDECADKKRYKSKGAAMAVLRTMGKYHLGSKEHHAYFCRHCKYWHIGKMSNTWKDTSKKKGNIKNKGCNNGK